MPLFQADLTEINRHVSFAKRAGRIYYFNGPMPVSSLEEEDWTSFRMFTSQLCHDSNCTQAEVARDFGVSAVSLKRYLKKFRAEDIKGFYAPPARRGPGVLTPEVMRQAQGKLAGGQGILGIAAEFKLRANTLNKAVRSGRPKALIKKSPGPGGGQRQQQEPA